VERQSVKLDDSFEFRTLYAPTLPRFDAPTLYTLTAAENPDVS